MKKYVWLASGLCVAILLSGCGSQDAKVEKEAPQETTGQGTNVVPPNHPPVSSEKNEDVQGQPISFADANAQLQGITDKEQIFGMIEGSADAWEPITKEARTTITEDLYKQYQAGTYLNEGAILQNLYNGALAAESFSREYKMQTPADEKEGALNAICINLYRNLKFVYRGLETKDSTVVKENEQMSVEAAKAIELK